MWYFDNGLQDRSFETIDEALDDFHEGGWAQDEIYKSMQEELPYANLISMIFHSPSIPVYDIYEALARASERVFYRHYYEEKDEDKKDENANKGITDENTNKSED